MPTPPPAVQAPNPLASMMNPAQAGAMVSEAISRGYQNKLTQRQLDAQDAAGNAFTGAVQPDGSINLASGAQSIAAQQDPGIRVGAYSQLAQLSQQQSLAAQQQYLANKQAFDATAQQLGPLLNTPLNKDGSDPLDDPKVAITQGIAPLVSSGVISPAAGSRYAQMATSAAQQPGAIRQMIHTQYLAHLPPDQLTAQTIGSPQATYLPNPSGGTPLLGATTVTPAGVSAAPNAVQAAPAPATGQTSADLSNGQHVAAPTYGATAPPTLNQNTPVPTSVQVTAQQLASGPLAGALSSAVGPQTPAAPAATTAPAVHMLGPGEADSMKASALQYNADASAAKNIQQNLYPLQESVSLLNDVKTGTGAQTLNKVAGALAAIEGPNSQAYQNASSAQMLNKYLTQGTVAQAAQFGSGTDKDLAAAFSGSPNMTMTNMANGDVLKAKIALTRAQAAIPLLAQKQGVQPGDYQTFASQTAPTLDPRAFGADYMTKAQITSMPGYNADPSKATGEFAKFAKSYSIAKQTGMVAGVGTSLQQGK